ncbi:DUF2382 domain-containing protein [Salinicoccus roseus]|uniref:DUF2382 domain-containing protein n=1 Tax=Salinicoccus roseus TaxID=45670 RepID=UPI001EF4F317|nr:DUF2382 domain-containing protein [Salinicoccus roseus]MCG7331226.1 DUF2382 domain-containing protein [Salinicoccus roseus]
MRKIESYMSEQELLGRIEQLKSEGVAEKQITVVSREELEGSSLNYTDVNYKTSEGSTWDKIVSWFSAEDPEERVMTGLNLNPQEEEEYKEALDSGKILLYVNDEIEGDTTDYPKDPLLEDDEDRVDRGDSAERPRSTPGSAHSPGVTGAAGATAAAGGIGSDEKDENRYVDGAERPESDRETDSVPGSAHNEGTTEVEGGVGGRDENRYVDGAERPEIDKDYQYGDRDNRVINDDMVEGRRDQNVVDTERDAPLDEREGRYGVDDRALNTSGAANDEFADRDDLTEEEKIQLREERLNVDKERVQTGEVNVDKHVETEHQEFDVPVEREEVTVERRPVDGDRPAGDIDGDDRDSINVSVNEERVNVDKEDVVSEEVVVKKDKVRDTEHVSEDVRREDVDIDETTNDSGRLDDDRLDRDKDRP